MLTFSTVQAEALCRLPPREIDHRQNKNVLPYVPPRRARYAKQFYLPVQCFFLLTQDHVRINWDLTIKEAAWVVRQLNAKIVEGWDLVSRDGWLMRKAMPEGVFNLWLVDREGVLEFLREPPEEEFEWSPEALAAEADMRARNVPEAKIGKLLLAMEGERLLKFYRKQPQKVWVLHLTSILENMEEAAKGLGFELPPREDRAGWFGTSK